VRGGQLRGVAAGCVSQTALHASAPGPSVSVDTFSAKPAAVALPRLTPSTSPLCAALLRAPLAAPPPLARDGKAGSRRAPAPPARCSDRSALVPALVPALPLVSEAHVAAAAPSSSGSSRGGYGDGSCSVSDSCAQGLRRDGAPLLPLPLDVEGCADDPNLANPLERAARLGTSWFGVVVEPDGVVYTDAWDTHVQAWAIVADELGLPRPLGQVSNRYASRNASVCHAWDVSCMGVLCMGRVVSCMGRVLHGA